MNETSQKNLKITKSAKLEKPETKNIRRLPSNKNVEKRKIIQR